MKKCEECEFWNDLGEPTGKYDGRTGECLRYAPRPLLIRESEWEEMNDNREGFRTYWPVTGVMDRCGEFKQKVGPVINNQ